MIAEPYICTKGSGAGTITWIDSAECYSIWINEYGAVPYADFEREKLAELWKNTKGNQFNLVYHGIEFARGYTYLGYYSDDMIGFDANDYCDSSESSRLLKRAEFLKAVCEKEGVEWLAATKRFHELDGDQLHEARNRVSDHLNDLADPDWRTKKRECICQESRELTCPAHGPAMMRTCARYLSEGKINCTTRCKICREPERDYYTKAEVDEQFKGLTEALVRYISDRP